MYKHIETCIGRYIVTTYTHAVEVGIGENSDAASLVARAGKLLRSTDIKNIPALPELAFRIDDIFEPDLSLYQGADVVYAIRPAIEMIPPLRSLAETINADLIVYHLGFESYGSGGEKIDCGVILHRYVRCQNPSNRVA